MASRYLGGLSKDERADLEKRLLESQRGTCFICGSPQSRRSCMPTST